MAKSKKIKFKFEYPREYWVTTANGVSTWKPLTEHEATLERLKGYKVQLVGYPQLPK